MSLRVEVKDFFHSEITPRQKLFKNSLQFLKRMAKRMTANNVTPKEDKLSNLSKKLKEEFKDKIENIILFGSYARGNYSENSDIDILVIVDDDRIEKEVRRVAYSFIPDVGRLISVKVIEKNAFKTMKKMGFSLVYSIEKEGISIG